MELKELYERVQENWGQMKAHMDLQAQEVKKFGEKDAARETAIAAYSTQISKLEDEIKALRAAPQRPIVGGTEATATSRDSLTGEAKARHDLYFKALRVGVANMAGEERESARSFLTGTGDWPGERRSITVQPGEGKALSLGDETSGGYLAPSEFVLDIIKGVQLISPIRPLATVRPTSRRSVQYPVRTGVFAARWVSETGTRAETAGLTYALEEIPNHEMYADVLVSDQDLEDSAFNLEQEILDNATEQFAKAEGAAFVNGTGVGQPEGIVSNQTVNIVAQGTGGGAALVAQGLLNTWGALKSVYAQNSTWLMNRQSIVAVRGLTDSQGRFLWEPGLADGTPPNLLGSPYIEIPDMPNIAANAVPIVYGNLKRSYLIVDRINIVVRRLQEKYAESGQIAYLVRRRVGGQVVLPEALVKMRISVA